MEVKVSHRRAVLSLPKQALTFPPHSFSFKQHFGVLSKKWRIQLQEVADDQNSSKHLLVHVVKEGETLTSISKQYGVSVYSIAALNKNVSDVDLIFEGQKLNVPSSRDEIQALNLGVRAKILQAKVEKWKLKFQLMRTGKNMLSGFHLKDAHKQSLNIFDGLWDKKVFTMQIAHSLPHAKTTGYFLVLVPLIAFCIRCIMGAFHARNAGASGRQAVNESKGHRHGSKNVRWKSALSDRLEGDVSDSDSRPNSYDPSEDQTQVSSEEFSHAYNKLELDYEKFLSECGISKWGYWRGGSPK